MKKYKNNEPITTGDFWHAITRGGYITPSEVLVDQEKAKKLEEAIKLLLDWEDELENDGKLEYL